MAENIACPGCGRSLRVPEGGAPGQVQCPACRSIFHIKGATNLRSDPTAIQPGAPPPAATAWTEIDGDDEAGELADRPRYHFATQREFKPGGGLALSIKILIGFNLLIILAGFVIHDMRYKEAKRVLAGEFVPDNELDVTDAIGTAVWIVSIIAFVASAIVFIMWFYRAHANLEALGARDLQFTSGWAIGAWFIPFVNFVWPWRIAQEIWRNSAPDAVRNGRPDSGRNSWLITSWWLVRLVGCTALALIVMRLSANVQTWEDVRVASLAMLAEDAASFLAEVLALRLVCLIDRRQNERARLLDGNGIDGS